MPNSQLTSIAVAASRQEKIVIIELPPNVICYFANLCG